MNQLMIVGNLGKDPQLRYTPGGTAVLNFSLADTPRKKNAQGDWEDGETLWLDCTLWGPKAEAAAETLAKGSRVVAHGRLRARSWEDRSGEKRSKVEAVLDDVGTLPKVRHTEQGAGWSKDDPWGGGGDDQAPPF